MVTRAHVLLQVDPGRSAEAVQYLSTLDAVTEAVSISGPYDVIATVLAVTPEALTSAVGKARHTPGLFALRWCVSGPKPTSVRGELRADPGELQPDVATDARASRAPG